MGMAKLAVMKAKEKQANAKKHDQTQTTQL